LLLYSEQGGQLDVSGMKLYLDYRVVEHLKLDETEIFYREGGGVVIGVGIAQCGKKLGTTLEHPLSLGRHQHAQALHEILASIGLEPRKFSGNADVIFQKLTGHEPAAMRRRQ
jgi:hypothetical protein